jgi:flagellar motor switch protein FliN/FliY
VHTFPQPLSVSGNERKLAETFAGELVKVLQSTTGERPTLEVGAPMPAPAADLLAWQEEFTGSTLRGAWVATAPSDAHEIGSRMLKAAGISERDEQEAATTCVEMLRQALSSFTRAIGLREGTEITSHSGGEIQCPPEMPLVPIRFKLPDGVAATVYAHFQESDTEMDAPAAAIPENESLRNLDLLLDVELPVTVSFGRAQLPLKDVIKLTTGSVIELNKAVSEPVELIVNNCVIAKGEVVVVDGNFAVRIERVVSRQDRLRTIG